MKENIVNNPPCPITQLVMSRLHHSFLHLGIAPLRYYKVTLGPHPLDSRCIKASFRISEEWLNFLIPASFRKNFSWNCFKNNSIFFHLIPISSPLHPLQVENCDSNSRLVVDENDNGKFRLESVN